MFSILSIPFFCLAESNVVFPRRPDVYGMMLHTIWDPKRAICFTPGAGGFAVQCLRERIPVILVVRSLRHRKAVSKAILDALEKAIADPNDARFFRVWSGASQSAQATQPNRRSPTRPEPVPAESSPAKVQGESQADELDPEESASSCGTPSTSDKEE